MTVRFGSISDRAARCSRWSAWFIFRGRDQRRGQARCCRPTRRNGQPEIAGHQENLNVLDREVTRRASSAGTHAVGPMRSRNPRELVDSFTRSQLRQNPAQLLTASRARQARERAERRQGATHLRADHGRRALAYDVAPKDIHSRRFRRTAGAMNVIFRTGPSGLDARAAVVREIPGDVHPPRRCRPAVGLAVVGVGLPETSRRIASSHLRSILFVSCSSPSRLRSVVRRRSPRARADRGRRVVALRLCAEPQS